MAKRKALIIGCNTYDDKRFNKLNAPQTDVNGLVEILSSPETGGYFVTKLIDQDSKVVRTAIEGFYQDCEPDDLLFLYFSCHGYKNDDAHLYFITKDTFKDKLEATGIEANFVNRQMNRSDANQKVLVLDCCFSGAFAKGMTAKGSNDKIYLKDYFEGSGRIVLTSSTSIQESHENKGELGNPVLSKFTHHLIEGITTGRADSDYNGLITPEELHDYILEKLHEESSKQTPVLWVFERTAKIYIAYNSRKSRIDGLRFQAIEAERRSDWRKAVEAYSNLVKFENENQENTLKLEFAKEQLNLKILYDKAQKYLSDEKLLLAYQTFEHIIEIKSDFKDIASLLSSLKIRIEQKIEKLQEQVTLFRGENNFEAEEKCLLELKELSPENESLDSRLFEIQQQLKTGKSIKEAKVYFENGSFLAAELVFKDWSEGELQHPEITSLLSEIQKKRKEEKRKREKAERLQYYKEILVGVGFFTILIIAPIVEFFLVWLAFSKWYNGDVSFFVVIGASSIWFINSLVAAFALEDWGCLVLAFIVISPILLCRSYKPESVEDLITKSEKLFKDNKYKEAIYEYDRVLRFDPQNSKAYRNRGYVYFTQKQYDEAILDFNKAIEFNPKFGEAISNRGWSYYAKHDFANAFNDFNRLVELNYVNGDINAYSIRGEAYLSKGDYKVAIEDLNRAIAKNPESAKNYKLLAQAYFYNKQYDEALDKYEKYIDTQKDNGNTEAYYLRGRFYYNLADKNEDIFIRGRSLSDGELFELAKSDFEAAKTIKKDDLRSLKWLCATYIELAAYDDASANYNNAISNCTAAKKQESNSVWTSLLFSKIYYEQERYDEAIGYVTEAISNSTPKNYNAYLVSNAYLVKGKINLKKQDYQSTEANLKKAIELNDKFTDAYFYLGQAYIEMSRIPEAIEKIRKAVELKPISKSAKNDLNKIRSSNQLPNPEINRLFSQL